MPKSRLELLREIAHHAVMQRITLEEDGKLREILVDNLTARAVLKVHNAIPDHDRGRFMALPWDEMIRITRERLPLAS